MLILARFCFRKLISRYAYNKHDYQYYATKIKNALNLFITK